MAWSNLGVTLGSQGRLDHASTVYRRAIELDPNYSMAITTWARSWSSKGDRSRRLPNTGWPSRSTRSSPWPTTTWVSLSIPTKLTRRSPNIGWPSARPEARRGPKNLAKALRDQRKLDEAIAEYRKALALDPRDAMVHGVLGEASA